LASASRDLTVKVWVIAENEIKHDMNEGDEFSRLICH
jgi:hypothetical protein